MGWLVENEELIKFFIQLGTLSGVAWLTYISKYYHGQQIKALEAQMRTNDETNKTLQAQINLLKETQYDRALSMLKSQKEVFDIEREELKNKISNLITENETLKNNIEEEINKSFRHIYQKIDNESEKVFNIKILHQTTGKFITSKEYENGKRLKDIE